MTTAKEGPTKWPEAIKFSHPLRSVRLRTAEEIADRAHLEQAAFARGAAEGERRLSQQLVEQRNEMLRLQQGIMTSLQQAVHDVVRQTEDAVVQLAIAIAEKIVGETAVSAEMVEQSVRSAMAEAEKGADFLVELNPEDLELLKKINSPLLQPTAGTEKFRFEPSPGITRGGCLVHTRFGTIDARRETRWNEVLQAIAPA